VPVLAAGTTDAVNTMSVPAVGFVVLVVIDTAGCCFALTDTEIEFLTTFPKLSVTVPTMSKVPEDR
jgi:hypothetical protein